MKLVGSRDNLEPFLTPATVAKQWRDVSSATKLVSVELEADSGLIASSRSVVLLVSASRTGSRY
jgi:hypothetical protein